MHRSVQIVDYKDPVAWVRPIHERKACCESRCAMSLFSIWRQSADYPLPVNSSCAAGDRMTLRVNDRWLLCAALQHYGLPLISLVLPASIGSLCGWNDGACAAAGLGGYLLSQWFLVARGFKPASSDWQMAPLDEDNGRSET